MHVAREQKRVITVELGLMEAEAIVKQIEELPCNEQQILAQLRDRLAWNVTKAKEGS